MENKNKIKYLVEIDNPATHLANITLSFNIDQDEYLFYLPIWSPGSYLAREYSRHIQKIRVESDNGTPLFFEQENKNTWKINLKKTLELKTKPNSIHITYQMYCFEVSVRTSYIDTHHAFLHGPSILIGVKGLENQEQIIEYKFPPLWSKISTGLKEIGQNRNEFIYKAENYDVLIDAPCEIGCHETDGFESFSKNHFLAFFGEIYPHANNLKEDIKKIVNYIGTKMKDIPYEDYLFIVHFLKDKFGGLEHLNSTALHFDGRKLHLRKDYINFLSLVSHEYFHTWNVKRIRPKELGPFNYSAENYTRMHWLTEGLTSFVDELYIYRCGLITLKEYLELFKMNLNKYLDIPGRYFHSLETSSFNAWIKLYRPDENSNNSSVSYYLKGGLIFFTLHCELKKCGADIQDFINLLWNAYKENKQVGFEKDFVLSKIESLTNKDVALKFDELLSTTIDVDFEKYFSEFGMKFEYTAPEKLKAELGITLNLNSENIFINTVTLDSCAYKAGLCFGDEIIALNGLRVSKNDFESLIQNFKINSSITLLISRLGKIQEVNIILQQSKRILENIIVEDEIKAKKLLDDCSGD